MANRLEDIEVVPTGAMLGAEVRGLDFAEEAPREVTDRLREIWIEHKVLLLRGQHIDKPTLYGLGEALGGAQDTAARNMYLKAGFKKTSQRISDFPGISYISNLDENGKPALKTAASGSLEIPWHSDNSYRPDPPMGSILNAVELPAENSGETSFLDAVAGYATLPDDLKQAIEGKHMRHDNSHNTVGNLRAVFKGQKLNCREDVDGPVHPLVRIHPDTGERALYLSRRHDFPSCYIVEMSDKESEEVQDRIWAHITQDRFIWTHDDWQVGDLLMWDNQQVLHRRSPVNPNQTRFMHRTLVKSDGVISAWEDAAA